MIIGGGREITKDYNTVYFHEDDDIRVNKLEMWIAKQLGETLVKVYPNRQWNVNVDVMGGMVILMCPSLSQLKGYHIHMKSDTIDALKRKVISAAGEILERYGMKRTQKFDPDDLETVDRIGPYEEAITADSDGVDPIIRKHT